MKIAIPSKNRPEVITYGLFEKIYPGRVFIFVNDNFQKDLYLEYNPAYKIVVTNREGIQKNRNFILDYFKDENQILMLDDDIGGVYKLLIKKLKRLNNEEIKEFIEYAFNLTQKYNAKLWGIYPIKNPFFMNHKIQTRGFIIGSFSGHIKNKLRFDVGLELKEDYDYTIKHLIKYGRVIRFDNVTAQIKHYTNKGGCVETRKMNKHLEKECCNKLLKKYPNFLRLNPKRMNEVLIK